MTPASVTLKRGRLDQLPPCAVPDISQVQGAMSLRDLAPDQPIQLSMLRQARWIRADQHALAIADEGGFRVNAEDKTLNNTAAVQNARVRMISGQVVSGVVDPDRNVPINL